MLFYPVTDANFDTASYREFADGYFLSRTGMRWFWDQYTTDDEQLKDLPPALVITGEADAAKLRQAGVPVTAVRYAGVVHDFVMLNALRETALKRALAS